MKNEFAFSQTLVGVAQLAADNDALAEIIELADLKSKVNEVFERMHHDLTDTYATLLPSLLWSSTVLDIGMEDNFATKATDITL